MFVDGWASLGRTALVGVLAYLALVAALRLSGKRTLAKMNAFDLVVTVALGSTLATVLLSRDVPLLDGVLAFALLVGLQFVVAWLSVRAAAVRRLVRNEPQLVVRDGRMLDEALRRERLTRGEVLAAARREGFHDLADVAALILETDGSFSVLRRAEGARRSTLADVRGVDEPAPLDG